MSAKGRPTGQAAQDEVAEAQAIDARTSQAKTTHEEGREWSPVADRDHLGEPASLSRLPPVWQRERRINIDPVQSGGLSTLTAGNRQQPRRLRGAIVIVPRTAAKLW